MAGTARHTFNTNGNLITLGKKIYAKINASNVFESL